MFCGMICLSIAGKYGPGKFDFKNAAYAKDRHNKYISTADGSV